MTTNSDGEIFGLREQVVSLEEKNNRLAKGLQDARSRLTELSLQLQQLSNPPSSYATFISANLHARSVTAYVGNRKMELTASALVDVTKIQPGQELILNEQLVVVGVSSYNKTGEIAQIELILDDHRALVKIHADDERILRLSGRLIAQGVRVGDMVLIDLNSGFALQTVDRPDVEHLLLEETPNVSYEDIGGLSEQIGQIRDSVELPFEQPDLYREHGLKPPKGVLLYGPPGCGKTLIAKAVATSLANKIGASIDARNGKTTQAYFMNIKGPQLLDKYVGETERQIREIFSRARDRASHGIPVVIFFDEMEALFRTRGSGVSSDVETTVVPQLLAEIDGVETLDNVIIIGASNREDMIDPAILRPGRLDVKIRIERPTHQGAIDILLKYLTPSLPLHHSEVEKWGSRRHAVNAMAEAVAHELWMTSSDNEFVSVTYDDGQSEVLYVRDFVSGAMLAAIVDRAKKRAIKNFLASGEKGITTQHLIDAAREEISQNEDLTAMTSPDEWARVNGRSKSRRVIHVQALMRNRHEARESLREDGSTTVVEHGDTSFHDVPNWENVVERGLI